MKKMIILGLTIAAVALNAWSVTAVADSKYPASDFEPSVIYTDKSVAAVADQTQNESDPKYPASNFKPIVVYVDNQLVEKTQIQAQVQDQFDPKYPAAYFKPKVIYP